MLKTQLKYKPKQVTKKIMSSLPKRTSEVIEGRFGLSGDLRRKTLESIGQKYGITRERVRQIEEAALASIRKSMEYQNEQDAFQELREIIMSHGGVVREDDFLNSLSSDSETRNHVNFHLVLGDEFTRHRENDDFHSRWSVDSELTECVHDSLKNLYSGLSDEELLSEDQITKRFMSKLEGTAEKYKNAEITRRWLRLSKLIGQNPLGEWGKTESSNINVRNIRDYAFLAMRHKGEPLHFRDLAKNICDVFGREVHTAACHNELIKDPRFVLVGRGIYALSSWGYRPGIVREIIEEIIKENGPLSREKITQNVLKERQVKPNTIMVNLQNSKYFKRNKDGLYALA